jgi:hypothetical protein
VAFGDLTPVLIYAGKNQKIIPYFLTSPKNQLYFGTFVAAGAGA